MKKEDSIAKQSYYLDREGNVVGEKGKDKASLLVREGTPLRVDVIAKYGFEGGIIPELEGKGKKVETKEVKDTKDAKDGKDTKEIKETK